MKTKRICEEVEETKCRLVGFTDCKLHFDHESYNTSVVDNSGSYHPFECRNETRVEYHLKTMPNCVNETRRVLATFEFGGVFRL